MDATDKLNMAGSLQLHKPDPSSFRFGPATPPSSPNEWFCQRYPKQFERFGSPFLEMKQPLDQFAHQILLVTINIDFFAGVLGGRKDLGHHVIYYVSELAWFFKDWDGIYRPTTSEKLANLYRALIMQCAQSMPTNVHLLNLFHEFRSDKIAKAVVNRAKSVLEADTSFFSPDSPHQRIKGPELIERVARIFVDELLTAEPGQILKLHDAYITFLGMLKQKNMPVIKRSDFKAVVGPIIREQFDVALRNDLPSTDGQGVRGWKNVRLVQTMPS